MGAAMGVAGLGGRLAVGASEAEAARELEDVEESEV